MKKVDIAGGVPKVLCEAASPFGGGTWSRDGIIVFSMPEIGTAPADGRGGPLPIPQRLWQVSDQGGQPTRALADATVEEARGNELYPWFLPDGRTLLYVASTVARPATIYAARIGSADRAKLANSGSVNVQAANGQLLFLRGGTLVAQPFDAQRLTVTGDAVPVANHVLRHGFIPGSGLFSVSENGVLAYQVEAEAATDTRLAWVDRQGHTLSMIGDAAAYRSLALSHDETRAVVVIGKGPGSPSELFVVNLTNGVGTQFTFEGGGFPSWSPDDRSIAFNRSINRVPTAFRGLSNGAGGSEPIFPNEKAFTLPFDQSRDGSLLYATGKSGPDLWVLPAAGDRTPFRLAPTPGDRRIGRFSPDGRWVAYVSYERTGQSVWVVPVVRNGSTNGKWRVSNADGGTLPAWSADGHELFYVSPSKALMSVPVSSNNEAFEAGRVKTLFTISGPLMEGGYNGWPYAVSKDGSRFLVMVGNDASSAAAALEPVSIEFNWAAALRK